MAELLLLNDHLGLLTDIFIEATCIERQLSNFSAYPKHISLVPVYPLNILPHLLIGHVNNVRHILKHEHKENIHVPCI